MNFNILTIEGCKTATEVMLARVVTMDDCPGVEIACWHQDGEDRYYQNVVLGFPNKEPDGVLMARRFIADFSKASALVFANSFTF